MVKNIEIKEHFSQSDHNIISWLLHCNTVLNQTDKTRYKFNKADFKRINLCLNEVNWDDKFKDADVNQMWTAFLGIVNSAVHKFTPACRKNVSTILHG